jgi:hypothetical protein
MKVVTRQPAPLGFETFLRATGHLGGTMRVLPPAQAVRDWLGHSPWKHEKTKQKRRKKMNVKGKVYTAAAGLMIACMAAATAHAQSLPQSGAVAVSAQIGLNQTDLFTVDDNNRLTVFWADGGGAWQGGQEIGPPILVMGGGLAASQQFGLNQTDVFAVDENGQLEVYWVAGGGAWQGPQKIGLPVLVPGGSVAVSQQFGLNQTDVFAIDKGGQLDVFWVGGGGAWQGPQAIGGVFAPGSDGYIAAGRQFGLNQTDVFVVDEHGRLMVFWVDGGGAWQGPKQIGPTGLARPQFTPITVSQQIGLNQTDIFLVDNTGQLDVFWVDGGGAWGGPEKIGAPGLFSPASFLAASWQFGLTQTDVFAIDESGQLDVFWVDGGGAWEGPEKIGGPGLTSFYIAASQQVGLNQTDVFTIDQSALEIFSVISGGAWKGPQVLY